MLLKPFKHLSTDLEAPIIDRCPGDIKTISTQRLTKLVLPGVKVTDNVGVHNFLTNIQNGSEVTFGQHNISYTASDKAANKAYCRFRITMPVRTILEPVQELITWSIYNFHTSVPRQDTKKIVFAFLSFFVVVICFYQYYELFCSRSYNYFSLDHITI